MTLANEESKVAKFNLQELIESAEEVGDGVGADVWYDGDDVGNEGEDSVNVIKDLHDAMLYVDRAMPDLVAAVRMLNDLVTAGEISKDQLEKARALTAKFDY